MLKKTFKRPKTSKSSLLKPLKIDSYNNSKISYQNEIKEYYNKMKFINSFKKNNNITNINESSPTLYQSKQLLNNNYTSLNSTKSESNIFKMNNSNNNNINQFSQFHNSFYIGPKLKTKTYILKKGIKSGKKKRIITLTKSEKINSEEIILDKDDLLLAAYKKNPTPLLESILRKTNRDKDLLKENSGIIMNKNEGGIYSLRETKSKEKRKLIFNKNYNGNKLIIDKKEFYKELLFTNNNQYDTSVNKEIEQCIAINNNCYNPILQYLGDSNYIQRNRFYRSKTENIDDIKNNSNYNNQKQEIKTINNFWLNIPKKTENNFFYNKININENNSEKNIIKSKKKEFADASSDTSLDYIIPNNFQNKFIKKVKPMINNTNINTDLINNKFKVYKPKSKLYKNNKYFNKSKLSNKKEDIKCNNSNVNSKNDAKLYNFKEVVDLFGKKIEINKKPKIFPYNNFRNRNLKYYSCSNNVNISALRRYNLKNRFNELYQHPEKGTKDSNMDFLEDIEAALLKNI